jgi:hypothetical protein
LNGPPSNLRGQVFLSNDNDETLSVKELGVIHREDQRHFMGERSALRIATRLKPGESKMEQGNTPAACSYTARNI